MQLNIFFQREDGASAAIHDIGARYVTENFSTILIDGASAASHNICTRYAIESFLVRRQNAFEHLVRIF